MKHYILFLGLALIAFSACEGGGSARSEIEQLEQTVADDPTTESRIALLEAYENYIAQYPNDAVNIPPYLYRMALLQQKLKRYSAAIETSKQGLENYHEAEAAPQITLLLADIYTNDLRNEAAATTARQAYLRAFPEQENASTVQQQLGDSIATLPVRMSELYRGVFDTTEQQINYRNANDFIYSAEVYALLLPEQEQVPNLLQQAAEMAQAITAYPKAEELFRWSYEKYPDTEKGAQSLFLLAFMYETRLNQLENARATYELFLEEYPDHEFADDAQAMLNNLGKSPEEILQQLEQPQE